MEDEGLKHEEIGDWDIMKRKALMALEDLKKEWGYKEKRKGKEKESKK